MLLKGAGRGLGKDVAEKLATSGHDIIGTLRNEEECEKYSKEIKKKNLKMKLLPLALDSFENVGDFPKKLSKITDKLDVLVLSAAVMQQSPDRIITKDGYEETLQVNVLSQVLLTKSLLPFLLRSPNPRIITLTSRLHLPGSRGDPVNFDFNDPNLSLGYTSDRAYKNSKLNILWFTYEFQRRLKQEGLGRVKINSFCPGFVPQNVAVKSNSWYMKFLLYYILPYTSVARPIPEVIKMYEFMIFDPSFDTSDGGQASRK